jgi:hypothetical protein
MGFGAAWPTTMQSTTMPASMAMLIIGLACGQDVPGIARDGLDRIAIRVPVGRNGAITPNYHA